MSRLNCVSPNSIGTKKRRLDTKVARAAEAAMDAHGDEQEHRMVQVDVYGGAGHFPDPSSNLAALLALGGG